MGNCGACHESGAPVRSENRIGKIEDGKTKRLVTIQQTTENQTKTNSFVRDFRFLHRRHIAMIAQPIFSSEIDNIS